MKRPELDRLIDHCPRFRDALVDYQIAFHSNDTKAMEAAWARATMAAQAFWAAQKRDEAAITHTEIVSGLARQGELLSDEPDGIDCFCPEAS